MTRQRREMIAELTDKPEAIIARMTAKLHAMVDAARGAMTPQQGEVIAELVGRYEALIAKVVASLNVVRTIEESAKAFVARERALGVVERQARALGDGSVARVLMDGATRKRPRQHPRWCLHLLDHPHLISDPTWRERLIKVLEVARTHVDGDPPLGSRDVAALIDWLQISGMPLEDARHAIATSTGKPYGTVKKSHQRYGGKAP